MPIGASEVVLEDGTGPNQGVLETEDAVADIVRITARKGIEGLLVKGREEDLREKVDTLQWRIDPAGLAGWRRISADESLVPSLALDGYLFIDLARIEPGTIGVRPVA
ncbi:MAG: hypothetical protein RID42_15640 [Alphaproteobacteria bacterium]